MDVYSNSAATITIDYVKRTGAYMMYGHHAHTEYELYYLMAGQRDYFIRDRTYRVERGSFVFIAQEELHKTTGTEDHERIVINFSSELLAAFSLIGPSGVIVLPPQEQY